MITQCKSALGLGHAEKNANEKTKRIFFMEMWIFINVFMMSLSLAFDVNKPLNLIIKFNGIKVEIINLS